MTRLGSRLSRGVGRMALGVFATAAAALLWAPGAIADPQSDASDAINQAWQAAGGDTSSVGTKDGDVYAVGDGFAQNFSGGKIFFTPATGAHLLTGAILDKYTALGGPADSDLGFPTIDSVPGLVGPDSRVSTFSASDKPAIFWTPDTGAWVVRGAINAAWDKLGGSAGTMGVPTEDETYNGSVVSQKFTGGEISYDTAAKTFSTVPPELANNLAGVEVPSDATTAINQAWRAAGGLSGPLGARQGAQQPIGTDGAAQDYAGGKIFYSPATGAHAVTGAILAKYEAAGGPTGDLGLPTGTEADGGAPNSRVSAFSAADKPVIFWTPDNGAIVVRGAINAAWAKLGGATGKLGVPTGEQSVNGDTVSQKFSGGEISWNKASNTFTTKPPELAGSLAGVQVPAAAGPQAASGSTSGKGSAFHWWWLLIIIPVLLLLAVIGLGLLWLQRRRRAGYEIEDDFHDSDYDDDDHWPSEAAGAPEASAASRFSTYPDGGVPVVAAAPGFGWRPEDSDKSQPGPEDVFDGDQDSIDTTPTRIPDEPEQTGGYEDDIDEAPAELEYAEVEELDDEESSDSGRHAAVNLGESQSMWRLNLGELGTPRRRRAAEPEPEPELEPVEPDPDDIVESDVVDIEDEQDASTAPAEVLSSDVHTEAAANRPAIHLPLSDPYQAPEGYVVKANTHSGLYYTPDSALYNDTVPEVWFASEELAQANGFHKAE
ncbi:LGFP repeat-containing protein [Mycolicibacterium sp.]|uniref:LGFP repeat-containing protein n=1 Tax=Mycolicibacterium sp. TaxID=2320850 RepID=UPI0037C63D7A